MLRSIENRLHLSPGELALDEVAALAAALTAGPLDNAAVQWLYRGTGRHPLYLRTVLTEGFDVVDGELAKLDSDGCRPLRTTTALTVARAGSQRKVGRRGQARYLAVILIVVFALDGRRPVAETTVTPTRSRGAAPQRVRQVKV